MILPLILLLAQQPNVLVIVADDFGSTERHLMPSLNALADCGVEFSRFYAYPTCSTSRIALLTGRYPRREGIGDLSMNAHDPTQDRLRLALTFLPEAYTPTHATALFGKWHLGRAPLTGEMDQFTSGPYCQGFETWRAGSPTVLNAGAGSSGYYDWWRVEDGNGTLSTAYATDVQRDAFLAWWSSTAEPKFGVLSWSAPHAPFNAPPGYSTLPTTRANYEQVINYLDTQLATTLAVVSLADTFVVFLADNGTPDDARPSGGPTLYWKGSTYEGGVRVPMIVAGPGIAPGESARLVSILDIAPTLAELTGTPWPAGDGLSFANALGAWTGTAPRAFVFTERWEVVVSTLSVPQPIGYDDQAVIETQWKLRRWDADGVGPGSSIDRAYYLVTDPWEQVPIDPAMLPAPLRNQLLAEMASVPPRAP